MEALAEVPLYAYIIAGVVAVGLIAVSLIIKKNNKDK